MIHVCERVSGRLLKIAQYQKDKGACPVIACQQIPHTFIEWASEFPVISWSNLEGLRHIMKDHVIWAHTSCDVPGWLEPMAPRVDNLDIHDLSRNHMDLYKKFHSITVPSEGYKRILNNHEKVRVVYSRLPQSMAPPKGVGTRGTVLVSAVQNTPIYRDYREANEYIPGGMDVFCANYPSDLANDLRCFQPMEYRRMLQKLTRYTTGYAGPANSQHRIDDVVTNKFWEYLAAGLDVNLGRWDPPKEMTEVLERVRSGEISVFMDEENV